MKQRTTACNESAVRAQHPTQVAANCPNLSYTYCVEVEGILIMPTSKDSWIVRREVTKQCTNKDHYQSGEGVWQIPGRPVLLYYNLVGKDAWASNALAWHSLHLLLMCWCLQMQACST
jgi:hypothetical protein